MLKFIVVHSLIKTINCFSSSFCSSIKNLFQEPLSSNRKVHSYAVFKEQKLNYFSFISIGKFPSKHITFPFDVIVFVFIPLLLTNEVADERLSQKDFRYNLEAVFTVEFSVTPSTKM